jgi:hypothetical protein
MVAQAVVGSVRSAVRSVSRALTLKAAPARPVAMSDRLRRNAPIDPIPDRYRDPPHRTPRVHKNRDANL